MIQEKTITKRKEFNPYSILTESHSGLTQDLFFHSATLAKKKGKASQYIVPFLLKIFDLKENNLTRSIANSILELDNLAIQIDSLIDYKDSHFIDCLSIKRFDDLESKVVDCFSSLVGAPGLDNLIATSLNYVNTSFKFNTTERHLIYNFEKGVSSLSCTTYYLFPLVNYLISLSEKYVDAKRIFILTSNYIQLLDDFIDLFDDIDSEIATPVTEKLLEINNNLSVLSSDKSSFEILVRNVKQKLKEYLNEIEMVREFEKFKGTVLRVKQLPLNNSKLFLAEENYWKRFYTAFTGFLFIQKGCFDNYTGLVMRNIKAFFNYLSKEKRIHIGNFYERFYVLKEQIPVITLLPEQVSYLMNNEAFEKSLSLPLRRTKDIFVFGCMVALRYCDLFNIRAADIEEAFGNKYLSIKTAKTGAVVKIKLAGYTLQMIEKLKARAGKRKILIPRISKNQFNRNIKTIAEKAGWTMPVPKTRNRRGRRTCLYRPGTKKEYRFCDLLSSHCMRRTAITMMLIFGIPEHIVRMISGHTSDSKSFYRYVNLVQSYFDNYIEKMSVQLSYGIPVANNKEVVQF